MNHENGVLNASQAAAEFGAHVETIRRLARRGEIPAFKIGKDWRFRRDDLLAWVRTHHLRRSPLSILVVDGEAAVCRVIRQMLEPAGYRVLTAPSGPEGLDALARNTVNLVLLDLNMPGMDGPSFLEELNRAHDGMPVIVVTGHPDGNLMARAMALGPLMLLAKPVSKQALLSAVHTVLHDTRSGRAAG